MASSSLGLTLKITPQVAEDLRRRNNELTDSKNVKDPAVVTTATNETSRHDPTTTVHSSSKQTNHTSSSPDEPRIPVVLVDFEKFVGYQPSSEEEALQLQRDIRQACFATGAFDARIAELLDSGSAAYELEAPKAVTVSTVVARIPYPPTIQDPRSDRQLETAVLYTTLEKRHPQIPILNRIYQNLGSCRRSLLWKYDLHTCLWDLAESELQEKQTIAHQLELYHWRTKRRSQELTQLYQVRETFQHRLEMAQIRLEKLEEERHVKMQQVLLEPERGGGLGALDFQTSHFHFPERPLAGKELLSGLQHDSDDDQENDVFQVMVDDEIDQPGFDNLEEDEENPELALPLVQEHENFPEEDFPDTPPTQEVDQDSDYFCDEEDAAHRSDDDGAARVNDDDLAADLARGKSTRRRRRRTKKTKSQGEKEAAVVDQQQKDEEYRQRLEQAYEEEDRVRELCTTPELRKAQAVVASLEQRAQRVEDLLESLQEEEWEDEETGVPKPVIQTTRNQGDGEMSLLDQILAMILGRLPQKDGTSMEEHYQYVQEQHQSIVQEWKYFFGRLPSSLAPAEGQPRSADQPSVPPPTSAELRMALGIEENESEDWESGYLDDDFDDRKEQQAGIAPKLSVETPPEPKPSPPKGGLRPGGSVGLRPGGRV